MRCGEVSKSQLGKISFFSAQKSRFERKDMKEKSIKKNQTEKKIKETSLPLELCVCQVHFFNHFWTTEAYNPDGQATG